GEAQGPQRRPVGVEEQAGLDVLAEERERAVVAEEPALGDDHLLDQVLDLVVRGFEEPLVLLLVGDPEVGHPRLQAADDQARPDRARVEAHPPRQDRVDAPGPAHGASAGWLKIVPCIDSGRTRSTAMTWISPRSVRTTGPR